MKKKRIKKVVKIGKVEKLIYSFALFLLVALPFTIVFLQATLSKINVQVEQVKKEIRTQEKKNQSLSIKKYKI